MLSCYVQVRVTEKLTVGAECYFQAALLYTTLQGQRRIRVHTMALQVTNEIGTMFKFADLDAQVGYMT
jgi:protein transport protein SEC24